MIREIVRRVRGDLSQITARHLDSIDSLLKQGKSGKVVRVPGLRVSREFASIVFTGTSNIAKSSGALKPEPDYSHTLAENGQVTIGLNNRELIIGLIRTEKYVWGERSRFTALLDATRVDLPLTVRPRRAGDRYAKVGRGKSTKVKELMIENRVPLNERISYPVITTRNDEIVWIPGLPVAAKFAAEPETKEWVVLNASFVDGERSE
jgi:tRNA(Ile)-lysidine synthase